MEGSMKAGDLLGVLECVPLDKEACCTVTSETLQHINLVETWLSPSHMWKMRHTYHDCLLPHYHGLGCQQQALSVPKRSFLKRRFLPTLSISLQAAVLVTLSCCDYTPWPRQLTEKKLSWLWLQRERPWRQKRRDGRQPSRKPREHVFKHKREADRVNWEWGVLWFSRGTEHYIMYIYIIYL